MCPEHSRCSTNLREMNFLIDELFSNMFVIIFKDKVNLFPNFIFLGRKYTLWGKSKKKKKTHTHNSFLRMLANSRPGVSKVQTLDHM